ncbi:MAG: Fic family protein, partial [Deltaproteobacteria bacterium]|nr:Fic family protein [Deltaproteobacteria bacterium]
MQPEIRDAMHGVYLAKGIHGTTAIEGNTLSEEQVKARIEGKLELPESKEYLGKEVDNVIAGCNQILSQIMNGGQDLITPEEIKGYNNTVLDGLTVEKDVVPGEIRNHSVGVFRYRGAPAEDCEFLLDRMCQWLNHESFKQKENQIVFGILRAVLAHLYIAWIHPFGDGNGRTARLIEFKVLLSHGAPSAAAHLLSNHYNQTRNEYYRQLKCTSKSGGDVFPFIKYAVIGLVDQMKEQASWIRGSQIKIAWRNYIYDQFKAQAGAVNERRRSLVLDLSEDVNRRIPFKEIRNISPRVAVGYAGKTDMAIRRDINALLAMELITKED